MATSPATKPNIVRGTVTNLNKKPLPNLKVEIFDVDMRNWESLSFVYTNRQGQFELPWEHKQLKGRGKKTADIGIIVSTKENETELFRSTLEQVRFNAEPGEEINITIRQQVPVETTEYDTLLKDVQFIAGKVPLEELEENKQNRDISFISKELAVPAEKIEYLALSHRLAKKTNADADFFYAILRKNLLLNGDFSNNLSARHAAGLYSDLDQIIFDLALTDPKKIEEGINAAAAEMIVGDTTIKEVKKNMRIIAGFKKPAEAYYKKDHPKKLVELVTRMVNPYKLIEIQNLFKENKNDLDGFFEKVSDPAFFDPKDKSATKKFNASIDQLFDFTKAAIPDIIKENKIENKNDIRKLARFNKARWAEEITKLQPGAKSNEALGLYTSAVVRKFETAFPTTAFAAQLERAPKAVLKNQEEIVGFFNKHEDFDLLKNNIDLYLKKKKIGEDEKTSISEELKSVQRIFKLVPNYRKTIALKEENIHSAYNIVSIGEKRFVTEVAPKAGISEPEAEKIYKTAEAKNTAAMIMIGNLSDAMTAMDVSSLTNTTLAKKIEAVGKDFPDLKTLFKLSDMCACEHCRSVYSPAAYLVEILQFLNNRTVKAGNAKTVLFTRRPDLGEIDLGWENANTPVKYVDLVCEILEEAIAPDAGINYTGALTAGADPSKGKISNALFNALIAAGLPVTTNALIHETEVDLSDPATLPHYLRDTKLVCKIVETAPGTYKIYRLRQTMASAEELDAAPEYVNNQAYQALSASKFAFNLPFDLAHSEARAYFERFGITRGELMEKFQLAGAPANVSIAAEKLGFSDAERQIIENAPLLNDNAAQQAFWNVPAPGNAVDYLKQVDHFLDRTLLTFKDLALLLQLPAIHNSTNLFIYNNDLTCDTAKKEIKNLDLAVLDRMHRFLRLQRKTGWKYEFLDEVISQPKLGNGAINANTLQVIADLKNIIEKTGLKIEELILCYGRLPHILLPYKTTTLYDSIFQNKAKTGTIEPGLSVEKIIENEAAAVKKQLADYKSAISVSIGIKETEFTKLVSGLANTDLSFANLSILYGRAKFMKKLKLKTEDFFIIQELTGIDLFASTANTLKFIKAVGQMADSPFKPADVKFYLRHQADNLADREIKTDKIEALLKSIQASYQKSFNENRSQYNDDLSADEQRETLKTQLAGLPVLSEADTSIIMNFLDRNWNFSWVDNDYVAHNGTTAADAITFLDDKKIADLFDLTSIKAALNTLATAAGPNFDTEQKAFIKEWLEAIALYKFTAQKKAALIPALVTAFKADPSTVDVVLNNALLKKTAPGTDILIDLLMTDAMIDTADITAGHPLPVLPAISEAAFGKQYDALRLLHKLLPFITAFKINNQHLQWLLKNAKALGWLEIDNLPFKTAQAAISYLLYIDFLSLIKLVRDYQPVIDPADAENPVSFFTIMDLVLQPSTPKNEIMQAIALLTGYDKDNLASVDTYWNAVFNINVYYSVSNWNRLIESAEYMRMLSANMVQLSAYIQPVITNTDVTALRSNLKTRYDEDGWLSTLKEIMDKIRPQKLKSLVTYLLATNPGVKDENQLYEFFLVDVEMGACMPSSRIVLAHNSIQLFVQRCLMGLEPDAIADVESDPNWNQWKWMKNYRVWEANRKVFLYPENWYDVTLADDKSFQLKEFINELQQNELNNDTAELSIRNYMEKLDNLAFLEVKATWYDVPEKTMHVFARTKGGEPNIYYYRRFEKERLWTAWEKVELDISGNQLLAFKRNGRLHLAWLMFSEEAKPNQKTKVPANTDQGTEIDPDRPAKKLIIQLAISEYSNKRWQPKRVSADSISTPNDHTIYYEELERSKYNLMYMQYADQVYVFSSDWDGYDYHYKDGVFDIAGCKGYPEKVDLPGGSMPDFLPDFDGAQLTSQRYLELPNLNPDDLSVKNGMKPFAYFNLLNTTPGTFRISYPHQMTILDFLSLFYQYFLIALTQGSGAKIYSEKDWRLKIPMGTLLPYFMEDSWHNYVIIPGFYTPETLKDRESVVIGLNDDKKRTASDVFKLIEDISNWIKKMMAIFAANPPANAQAAINTIITDTGFQDLVREMSVYKALQPLLHLLIGKTGNDAFDEELKESLSETGLIYGEQFRNNYHPLVCALRTILYKDGVPGLMKRETQMKVNDKFKFKTHYTANVAHVAKLNYKQPDGTWLKDYPIEDVDFTSDGSYSLYNWDLFFRLPLHIAGSLTRNQRFEEALTWFHYIFNPTGALPGTSNQKYWVTKPFFLNQDSDYLAQKIDVLMYATADKNSPDIEELEFAIAQWREKPFRPDVVARFRPVAYQKAVLMKYIDNLTEWGDYLFRQDTMESVAQATQMYILADKLLGPKPRIVPPVIKPPYETYNQIEAKLDNFGNALIALENILPDLTVLPEGGAELPPSPITLSTLYFCIPHNEKMFEYWDRVADRLFKIRHCQNIDGIERSLALFAPPIDPGMLVKAAASGMSISDIINGLNAPSPFYRFNVLAAKASELVQEVRSLGNALLQGLEKKDAENLSLLRNELEMKLLNAVKEMKKLQISESKEQVEILKRTQKVTQERLIYYQQVKKINPKEQLNLDKLSEANDYQTASQIVRTVAGALRLVPEFHVGASGFGGSPQVVMQLGGSAMSGATNIAADILNVLSSVAAYEANRAGILGGYDRRFDDWKLQERLASKELDSIELQIKAAGIRKELAEKDLDNHMLQIENAKKTDEFMRSKYTNVELYDWMIGQVSAVYFKSYQLAHDFAKKAERCYRFELGNDDSFIQYGYWDSLKKGLQSADHLIYDLKKMETSYLDKNKREYEITKNVSLAQLDPLALIKLRTQGVCDFDIPEALFDMDHAGHYFRRIKSVSISLPCIAGPNTSISARLSLINNRYRKNTNADNAAGTGYIEDFGNDERFTYNVGSIQSIATSTAQNDSGVFELNFKDERYLPFEGTGAISGWRLELPNPTVAKQFNYETIADVVLHVKYTAREGGSTLKTDAETNLVAQLEAIEQQIASEDGIHMLINLKHDMPNEWHILKQKKSTKITITRDRLPYFLAAIAAAEIDHIKFISKSPAAITIKIDNLPVPINTALWGLFESNYTGPTLDTEFTLAIDSQAALDTLENLILVLKINLT